MDAIQALGDPSSAAVWEINYFFKWFDNNSLEKIAVKAEADFGRLWRYVS